MKQAMRPILRWSVVLTVLALAAGLAGGCRSGLLGSPDYREVHYYALQTPTPQKYDGYNLEVASLRMLAAGRNKMVYRDATCQVLVDEYNKWVQSPSFLVRQYLQTYFSASPDNVSALPVELTLKGSVVVFEINLQDKEALLGVEYTIVARDDVSIQLQNSVLIREKFTEERTEQYAQAMSRAVDRFCHSIARDAVAMVQRVKAAEAAGNIPLKAPDDTPAAKAPTVPVKAGEKVPVPETKKIPEQKTVPEPVKTPATGSPAAQVPAASAQVPAGKTATAPAAAAAQPAGK